MSTGFYFDKEQKEFLCERRGIGLGYKDFGKDMTYVFSSWSKLRRFLEMKKEELIYDEYGVVYTVDSLRNEIRKRGCIIIVYGYMEDESYKEDKEVSE